MKKKKKKKILIYRLSSLSRYQDFVTNACQNLHFGENQIYLICFYCNNLICKCLCYKSTLSFIWTLQRSSIKGFRFYIEKMNDNEDSKNNKPNIGRCYKGLTTCGKLFVDFLTSHSFLMKFVNFLLVN